MSEKHSDLSFVTERFQNGPLAPFIKIVLEHLRSQNCTRLYSWRVIRGVFHFCLWINDNGIIIRQIRKEHLQSYIRYRIENKLPIHSEYLTGANHLFKSIQKGFVHDGTPVGREIARFSEHLRENCGLSEKHIRVKAYSLSNVLRHFFQDGQLSIKHITPMMISDYIEGLPKTRSNSIRKKYCCSIRSYVSFLKINGRPSYQIESGLPVIHGLPRTISPIILSSEDMSQLLNSVDRSTREGKTTHLIIMCLSELALRMEDVLRLTLDDIDWRSSKIKIPIPKNATPFYHPLTRRVGESLADYIRNARPESTCRQILLRKPNGIAKPMSPGSLAYYMNKQWAKAGLSDRFHGTRILRHTTATNLVQKGFGIKVIADVLGHRTLESTSLYAQVDIPSLRLVARPWPDSEVVQ